MEFSLHLLDVDHRPREFTVRNLNHKDSEKLYLLQGPHEGIAESVSQNLVGNPLTFPDPELLYRVLPNPDGKLINGYSGINSFGFRGEEFDLNTERFKMMIVGDSCAFGWGIKEYEKTFPALLKNLLSEKGKDIEIFNIAQPGYSSTQCAHMYKKWVDEIQPDLVVLYLGWNDIWPTAYFTDEETIRFIFLTNNAIVNLIRESRVYGLVYLLMNQLGLVPDNSRPLKDPDDYKPRVNIANVRENYKLMTEGHESILIIPPYSNEEGSKRDQYFSKVKVEEYLGVISHEFKDSTTILRLKTMEAETPKSKSYFSDGYHPNEKGAEYISAQLFELIQSEY